jgi:hypothetical protein
MFLTVPALLPSTAHPAWIAWHSSLQFSYFGERQNVVKNEEPRSHGAQERLHELLLEGEVGHACFRIGNLSSFPVQPLTAACTHSSAQHQCEQSTNQLGVQMLALLVHSDVSACPSWMH